MKKLTGATGRHRHHRSCMRPATAQRNNQSTGPSTAVSLPEITTPPSRRSIARTSRNCELPGPTTPASKAACRPAPSSSAESSTPTRHRKRSSLSTPPPAAAWKFDSGIAGTQPARGLAYWSRRKREPDPRRRHELPLCARSSQPASRLRAFGENGRVDLRKDLGRDYTRQAVAMTSPGVVYKDLIIVGFRAPETPPAPPGDIRAYDVRTGKLRWSFHTIPHPGEFGYDTWPPGAWDHMGAANNWAGMTVDIAARHRLRPDRLGGLRLLWWRPRWRRPLRQYSPGPRRRNRQTHLVLPGRASRYLGSRLPVAARAAHGHTRWQEQSMQSRRPPSRAGSTSSIA